MNDEYKKYFGSETVLYVEDEEMVRNSFRDFLELYGYNVIVAVDGQDAIDKYIQNSDKIDLVFSDIILPRKNGISVYREIKSINPGAKYILSSGYVPTKSELQDIPFVKKPFDPAGVVEKIREVLDSESSV